MPGAAHSAGLTSIEGKRGSRICFFFREPCHGRCPISDQDIAILCDVLEGGVRIEMQIKGRFLISLLRKVLSWLLTKSCLSNTNLPEKLNNFSPSAALD